MLIRRLFAFRPGHRLNFTDGKMPLLHVKSINPTYRNATIGTTLLTVLAARGVWKAVGWFKFGFWGMVLLPAGVCWLRLLSASMSFVRKIDLLEDGKRLQITTLLKGVVFELDIDNIEDPEDSVEHKMMMAMMHSYIINTTIGHTFIIDKNYECFDSEVLKEVLVGNEIEIRPGDKDIIDV